MFFPRELVDEEKLIDSSGCLM